MAFTKKKQECFQRSQKSTNLIIKLCLLGYNNAIQTCLGTLTKCFQYIWGVLPLSLMGLQQAQVQLNIFAAIWGTLGRLPTGTEKTARDKFSFTLAEWKRDGWKLCGACELDTERDTVTLFRTSLQFFTWELRHQAWTIIYELLAVALPDVPENIQSPVHWVWTSQGRDECPFGCRVGSLSIPVSRFVCPSP